VYRAYLELSIAMFIVGSSVVVGKSLVASLPIFLLLGLRLGISTMILVPLVLWSEGRRILLISKKQWLILGMQALTGVFLFNLFLLYGLRLTSAVESGIILSTTPAMIALLSVFLLGERVSSSTWLGISLSVLGIIIINVVGGQQEIGNFSFLGNMLILLAVVCESLFTLFRKLQDEEISAVLTTAVVSLLGLIMVLPFMIYEGLQFDLGSLAISEWLMIVYYGVFVTVIAFVLWFRGVSRVSASTAGVFTGIMPVSTIILSYLFLQEQVSLVHFLGVGLIFCGILLAAKDNGRRNPT